MTMKRGKARTFDDKELRDLLDEVTEAQASKNNAQPAAVMRAAFMLTFYMGLRVQEIAGLEWNIHVFNGNGKFREAPMPVYKNGEAVMKNGEIVEEIVPVLEISASIGKYGKERRIAIPAAVKAALMDLYALGLSNTWVIPSAKGGATQDLKPRAHALKMRINRMYKQLGLARASSHSGRRSFITRAIRRAETVGNSIDDVRRIAGHASITTTQKYIDPSPRERELVEVVWAGK